ncbi:NHL repeat-containing protein [Pontibacter sp. XAAS-A31]|nr:NHL repeat-containing protein [Pontibacter harenae]
MINVAGIDVRAVAADDNQLMFLMPAVPSGKATVDFSGAGFQKQAEITVGNYATITNTDAVAAQFTNEIGEIATRLEAHMNDADIQLDARYITVLNEQRQVMEENFAKLSAEEKLQVAYFFRSNMPNDEDFILNTGKPESNLRTTGTTSGEDVGEELVSTAKSFGRNVVKAIPFTYAGFKLILLPSPWLVDKVAAAGFLTAGFVYSLHALSDLKKVSSLTGVLEEITGAERMAGPTAGEILFYKDKVKLLSVKASFRNLNQSDKNSTVSEIASLFTYVTKFQDLYDKTVSIANKVKSWFPTSGTDIPAYANPIGAKPLVKEYALPGSKLSIKNVSDPAIQLAATTAESGMNVTAKSATITQDKAFSFDIVYTDTKLEKALTKKINATFKAYKEGVTVAGGNGAIWGNEGFINPKGIFVDASNNIYVADTENNRVQKWAPGATSGVTVAGGGPPMSEISSPTNIFVDATGNLYIVEGNLRVVKWAPGAMSGTTIIDPVDGLVNDIFVDKAGNVYVADSDNRRVQKWAPGATSGVTVASGDNEFRSPIGVFVDDNDNLYVLDNVTDYVTKWAPGASSGTRVVTVNAMFEVTDIFVDKNGTIYISDSYYDQVLAYVPGDSEGYTVAGGKSGSGPDQLSYPSSIYVDSKYIYIADTHNQRVQRWDK